MIVSALTMVLMCVVAAFVIDVGHAFWAKRALQRSVDAAALAGAQSLPDRINARKLAVRYSGSQLTPDALLQGESCEPNNLTNPEVCWTNNNVAGTQTIVCVPGDNPRPDVANCGDADKVVVQESATIDTYFAGIFGEDTVDVHARAVVRRGSQTTTKVVQGDAKFAIFTYGSCTEGTNGFESNGDNMLVEGNIHSNGWFLVKNKGFDNSKATKLATVWRPQGSATASTCKDASSTQYGEITTSTPVPKFTGGATRPTSWPGLPQTSSTRRYWPSAGLAASAAADPYEEVGGLPRMAAPASATTWDAGKRMKCTHTSANITASSPDGVYCVSSKATVDIGTLPAGVTKRITVIAPEVEIKQATRWSPHCLKTDTYTPPSASCNSDSESLLVYDRGPSSVTLVGTSAASTWSGWIINRTGDILVNNSSPMTTSFQGYLEARYVKINGADFRMIGTTPDPSDTTETTVEVVDSNWTMSE